MRIPNPLAAARLMRSRIHLVPDPVGPDPHIPAGRLVEPPRVNTNTSPTVAAAAPRVLGPFARCGHCSHGHRNHGRQYGALVGWHTWAPEQPKHPKSWSEICEPPEGAPDE